MLRLTKIRPIYKEIPPKYFVKELDKMLTLADFESMSGNKRECYRYYCYSLFGYSAGWYDPETHLAYPAYVVDDKLGIRMELLC